MKANGKGFEFEVGKTYYTVYRLDRVFFEVVDVSPRTVTFKYVGNQHDKQFELPNNFSPINGETQRVSKRYYDALTEFGWVKNTIANVKIPECVCSQYYGYDSNGVAPKAELEPKKVVHF